MTVAAFRELAACRFGDAVLQTTADFAHQQASLSSSTDVATARVLDVGTGNGTLALELCKRGFQHVTGSDYSIKSIELAKAVAQQAREQRIEWVTDDILATQLQTGWVVTSHNVLNFAA